MGCFNSIVISAPTGKVWNTLKKFHDLSWSKNVITKLEIIGDKKDTEIGAQRVLNDAFHETLQSVDNEAMTFTYSIEDGPGPAAKENMDNYICLVTVFSVTENNSSFVLWTSDWESSKEDNVADFFNPIYHALLQDLKEHFSSN